ncbi:uncharacterized protein LOC123556078 [Mercenaria mercenaria]|uniref:uncharacterized protein LOC123556078 n=1 Tax=Mercenaria mercenaria TaxID=6596 RepID=UPI00234F2154|nr:uncharacterized protein LOC123556078 [Mercenaria mercenaria]
MIDSINFLPMALSKLPAMFGFDELKKGYFPHLFNKKENQRVVLDGLPDLSFYNPDGMKPDDRQTFLKWYSRHKNDTSDFQEQLLDYCKSDTDILRRCCLRFREDFMDTTDIDPFEQCITMASACNLVFRTKFLESETIGLIPRQGYNPEQKQSMKALQWVKYISHIEGYKIQHARNGGEKVIGPYRVDGYYESKNAGKIVLEFHGDFWHGNPTKYSRSTVNPVNQLTMGELHDKTIEKQRYLENDGYTYICIWESEFDKQVSNDSNMRSFIESLDIISPLEPRDAFYIGRTEAYTLYKEASADETIDYYDVTSLYPWVNKTGKIPLGHPKIITENFKELDIYESLIKCKVLPPKGLFHPVLPCKCNGKLLFHLCRACAETKEQTPCSHNDTERSFTGTWVTDEVQKAIQKGYQIVKVYEVWHFDKVSKHDPITKTGGIFTQYVNTFLKIKQEASGWPKWCQTEQQKTKYINMYYQKEGILLDYENIKKNPGLRALAKLMLNSFWGKFGQRSNMPQVDLIEDPSVYFDKLTSDREEVTCVIYVSDEFVEMPHCGETKPELNDYLGDLTDEVPGNSIQTFITGGPKNYGYELQKPDGDGNCTHCKIRGITLSCKNMLNVNFDVLRTIVTKRQDAVLSVVNAHKIARDRNSSKLITISERKDYQMVFDKRVIGEHRPTNKQKLRNLQTHQNRNSRD